MANDQIQVPAE